MAETTVGESGASGPGYNLRDLEIKLFEAAKWHWRNNLTCQFGAGLYGILSLLFDLSTGLVVFPVFLLTVMGEFSSYFMDSTRGLAERLHDKLDLRDSFGWEIDNEEVRAILARTPESVRLSAQQTSDELWFENAEQDVVRKALGNLKESSWWTEELSRRASKSLFWISLVVAILVILYLVAVPVYLPQHGQPTGAKVGIAILSLLPSLGMIKLILGYYSLSQSAASIRQEANRLLAEPELVPKTQAMKLWFEYLAKRSSAPMLPSWIYRRDRNELNRLWKEYK